jgi:hypothetical protein
MGAGSSKAPPDLSKIRDAQRMTQEIFRYMVTQMNIEEYLALASPDQCKKYVILISDSLQKFFFKIKVTPEKDKNGFIYFRKLDDVRGATPQSAQYCMVMALYFVRIFQIYGALALSILDTDTSVYDIAYGGGLDALGEEEEEIVSNQTGGALPPIPEEPLRATDTLPGVYEALSPFLSRIRGDSKTYKFTGQYILMSMNPTIYEGKQQYTLQFLFERGGTFGAPSKQGQILSYMRMEASEKSLHVYLSGITIREEKKRNVELEESHIRIPKKTAVFTGIGIGEYGNLGEILKNRFLEILREGSKIQNKDEEDNHGRGRERDGRFGERKPGDRLEYLDRKIEEEFSTFKLLDRLKKMDSQPIKAHCIARALQLVSGRGLQKEFPTTVVSNICDSKFFSPKDRRFQESLPRMDEKIIESRGLFTLWQLFFDRILPDLSPQMSTLSQEKYKIATAFLSKAFQNESPQTRIPDIRSKTGSTYCSGKRDKQILVKNKEAIQALRTVTSKMLEVQMMHTGKVMGVLQKMFLILPGKPITLHPNILQGGLPYVNQLADEARSLLVAYYANCEGLYAKGVAVIERSKAEIRAPYM